MNNKYNQRKKIHLNGFEYKGSAFVYFVTLCAANKQSCFKREDLAVAIVKELKYRRKSNEIKLFCYCIMPDHLHMLISLHEKYEKTLQNWMSAFKRYTSKISNEQFNVRPLWQGNFYEHIVRKEESLIEIADYILNNPVRKGMVLEWNQYPYSEMVDDLPV